MLVYHVLIVMCFAASVLNSRKRVVADENKKKRELNIFFGIIVVYMTLLCGFRAYDRLYHIGIDTYGYFQSYDSILERYRTLGDIIRPEDINDRGYSVIYWIFAKMHFDFTVLLVIFAAVYIGAVGAFIYKYSKNILMSLLVFAGLGLYTFAFSTIRQSLAMGLCLIGYMLDDRYKGIKGFVCFALFLFMAWTIHASAIVFAAVYIFNRIPLKRFIVVIMVIAAVVGMLFKEQFSNLVLEIAGNISDKYESYSEEVLVETQNAGMRLYIFVAAVLVLRLIFSGRMERNRHDDIFVYMMLLMLLIFPATQGGGAIMRVYFYYYIFIVVFIPNSIENMRNPGDRAMMYTMMIGFLMYYYLTSVLTEETRIVPYHFFWQSTRGIT